jgi:cyclic-di-GMP phosphodiesterase TipF (flagellum assembly factor)
MPPPLPGLGRGPREADVEVIQDAIKRLLEEVNAAEAQATQMRIDGAAAQEAALPSEQVEYSVDALKMAAQAMRVAGQKAEAMPPPVPQTLPDLPPFVAQPQQWAVGQTLHPSQARAQLLSDAIKAGRIDVRLEPILGLEDQQTRHYEVSVRLRDATGAPMDVDGTGPDLRGTGLLPLFDSVRVTRTAAVARRLEERGKSGSIFSSFNGESVVDEGFLGELAETLHQRASLAAQLVLSFTQADVRGFAAAEWDSLADMRALGFRFALSDITDLDMDFEALAEQGFAFVKLDADVFLKGLPAANGTIPSSDVCRHLAKLGLTLVVEHIDHQDKLARIFGFGVLLGQGQLFGGPRPVRSDIVSASGTAAA